MTAEIALLNKTAVALAADSAVTLSESGKIYPGNKLFALSRYQPVGVMIYNNAEFMGVPWETLIKMYRQSLGSDAKPTIYEYLESFLEYIGSSFVCTEEQELINTLRIVRDLCSEIRGITEENLRNISKNKGSITIADKNNALQESINDMKQDLTKQDRFKTMKKHRSIGKQRISEIISDYGNKIDEYIDLYFQEFDVDQSVKRSLHRVFRLSIGCDKFSRSSSGIVIAGLGTDEMFPTLFEVTTDGFVAGIVKSKIQHHIDIGRNGISTAILPFAQQEMVQRFMEGIDPVFLKYTSASIEESIYQFGKEILDVLELSNPERTEMLRNVSAKHTEKYSKRAIEFRKEHFVDPIMDVVEHLPKEELANMAEALVSLTSLKRRVSLEQETVGGPIDVAVISKGDGFIWIKRKHYFDPILNAGYVERQRAGLLNRKGGNDDARTKGQYRRKR